MITLEEYLKYALKRWKLILAIVAGCTVLFTGAMYLFYETVVTETSVLQQYYSEQVELYEDIVENKNVDRKDEAFFDDYSANRALLFHFREELRMAPIGYMENVTVKSAMAFGITVGCILSVGLTFSLYVKNQKLRDDEE